MENFWLVIKTFLDSPLNDWESGPAILLLITTVWLFAETTSLTGWPSEDTWDERMRKERESAQDDAGRALIWWFGAVVLCILAAGILSFTSWGQSNSFVTELLWIFEYAVLFLVEIVLIGLAVAGLVRTMIRYS